jgi:hypothetical protein
MVVVLQGHPNAAVRIAVAVVLIHIYNVDNAGEIVARRTVDVAVIIPDASPVLTLARIGRIDLLGSFSVPVRIVDQVNFEIRRQENDPQGEFAAALARLHNQIEIVETNVGVGYQTRRARNPQEPSGNLGEIAVDEYATTLAHSTAPSFVPLVLFETRMFCSCGLPASGASTCSIRPDGC